MIDTRAIELSHEPISVVIPAYNLGHYIRDAIESVLKQDYAGPLSIVVLDDGSSDNTWQVVAAMAATSPNIRCYTQPNQGRVAARNRLLQLAPTELVAWLDGDDIAAITWISDQTGFLREHPEVVAVSGQGYAMTASGQAIGPIRHPLTSEEIHTRHIAGDAATFFQSCVMTRKTAVERAGSYREKYPAGEDYDLWLRLHEIGKLANLDRYHLFYRVHPTSANWTERNEQREQGASIVNEARERNGLPPFEIARSDSVSPTLDDWHRRIYWINIALRSGNPKSALDMLWPALQRHPCSLLLWFFVLVGCFDAILFFGNKTTHLQPGHSGRFGDLPWISTYRLGRFIVRLQRSWRQRPQ